jgi:hypothetical protein
MQRGRGLTPFLPHPAKERREGLRKSVLLVATKLAVVGALALHPAPTKVA